MSLLSHHEAACSSPKMAGSVKSKSIVPSFDVIFRDRLSPSLFLACWYVNWSFESNSKTHLPHLLRASSHHGSPDAPQEKAGGSCAPSQHHIIHILRCLGEPCVSYIGYDATTPLDFFLLLRIWTLIYYIVVSWSYTHAYYTTFEQVKSTRSSFQIITFKDFSQLICLG